MEGERKKGTGKYGRVEHQEGSEWQEKGRGHQNRILSRSSVRKLESLGCCAALFAWSY